MSEELEFLLDTDKLRKTIARISELDEKEVKIEIDFDIGEIRVILTGQNPKRVSELQRAFEKVDRGTRKQPPTNQEAKRK